MTILDFWRLFAGLGLFLYGMFHLEDAMKGMDGRGFKLFLKKHTKNKLSAILSGTFVTAALQSSSIVNLMALSFVGAGMLSMRNALGVVFGANVGGTFNSWLVALLGFKVEIGKFTLPIIALSGIGLMVFKNRKRIYQVSKFCMGFGLLFLGLQFMKESMDASIKSFDFTPWLGYHRIFFVLIGLVITTLIQTSAATVVIVLSALYAKVIPIETAVAVVLGAELGTTVKIGIGALGGIAAKKRVAAADIFFNLVTTAFGFLLLVPIIQLLRDVLGVHDPLFILVAFQTFINIAGVISFYFFLNYFGDFLEKRFAGSKKTATPFLQNASPEIYDTAIEMLEKEVGLFIYRVMHLNKEVFQIKEDASEGNEFIKADKEILRNDALDYTGKYNLLKQAEGEILFFYSKMMEEKNRSGNIVHLNQLVSSVKSAMYSAKGMKDINQDRKEFSNSANDLKYGIYQLLRSQLTEFYEGLEKIFFFPDTTSVAGKLLKLAELSNVQYEQRISSSYKDAAKNSLKEVDISTLFNVNRELYSSGKAIIFSMKDYLLDSEGAEKFEMMPSFVVK